MTEPPQLALSRCGGKPREPRLSVSLFLHHDRSIQRRCTDPPVDLALHFFLTCEKDPEILKLLHLRQGLFSDWEMTNHLFPVEFGSHSFKMICSNIIIIFSTYL